MRWSKSRILKAERVHGKQGAGQMLDRRGSSPLYASLKIFSWVVMILMVLAILYAGWLSLINWTFIKV